MALDIKVYIYCMCASIFSYFSSSSFSDTCLVCQTSEHYQILFKLFMLFLTLTLIFAVLCLLRIKKGNCLKAGFSIVCIWMCFKWFWMFLFACSQWATKGPSKPCVWVCIGNHSCSLVDLCATSLCVRTYLNNNHTSWWQIQSLAVTWLHCGWRQDYITAELLH